MCCFLRNVHFTHGDKWNRQWLLHSHQVLCPKSCPLGLPNYFQRGGKGHPLNMRRWEGLGLGTANHLCPMDGDEKDLKHLPTLELSLKGKQNPLCPLQNRWKFCICWDFEQKRKDFIKGELKPVSVVLSCKEVSRVKRWPFLISQTNVSASLLILKNQNLAEAKKESDLWLRPGPKAVCFYSAVQRVEYLFRATNPGVVFVYFFFLATSPEKSPKSQKGNSFFHGPPHYLKLHFSAHHSQRKPNRRREETPVKREGHHSGWIMVLCSFACLPVWPPQSFWPNAILLLKSFFFQIFCYPERGQFEVNGRDEK